MIKVIQKITIIIFVVLLALPIVFMNHDPNHIITLENKIAAKIPVLFSGGSLNKEFISGFEDYWNDNIGFQKQATVLNIALFYKLFGKLKVTNYIMGKNKHLYYTSDGFSLKTYQGKNKLSEETLGRVLENFSDAEKYFNNRGAEFLFVPVPDKEGVYPEYYLDSVLQYSNQYKLDQIISYLNNNSSLTVINLRQALIESKNQSDYLYYKNYDCTHWNMKGAFVSYKKIMHYIQDRFDNINILSEDDFEISLTPSSGTIAHLSSSRLLSKAMGFKDIIYSYNKKGGYVSLAVDDYPLKTIDPAYNKYYRVNDIISDTPKLLILGDSFIYSFLLDIFGESFRELYFTSTRDPDLLKKIVDEYKPDIVIFEIVERAYWGDDFSFFGKLNYFDILDRPTLIFINVGSEIQNVGKMVADVPYISNTVYNGIHYGHEGQSNVSVYGDGVQRSNRYGASFSYHFDNIPQDQGPLSLVLISDEIWKNAPGQREFNVTIETDNNKFIIEKLDPYMLKSKKGIFTFDLPSTSTLIVTFNTREDLLQYGTDSLAFINLIGLIPK
jgi:hypothetical protein